MCLPVVGAAALIGSDDRDAVSGQGVQKGVETQAPGVEGAAMQSDHQLVGEVGLAVAHCLNGAAGAGEDQRAGEQNRSRLRTTV